MVSVSMRIKEAMEFNNIKQTELVEKTGISKGAISSYISGKYIPKQKNIYLISKALNVDEGWLMGCDVPMERHTSQKTVYDIVETFKKQLNDEPITLDGEPLTDEIISSIISALDIGVEMARRKSLSSNTTQRVQEAEESYIKSRSMIAQQMDGTASSSIGDTERKVSNQ